MQTCPDPNPYGHNLTEFYAKIAEIKRIAADLKRITGVK